MVRAVTSDRFVAGARIGDYQIEDEVAIDAIAVTYLATHVVLPRQAYIKVPHPGSQDAAIQLLREACILEALCHAGIPRVYECGVIADRRPWCAVEVMTGVTFKQLAGDGPLALSDLVVALRDVADILRHAHGRGVVHGRLTMGAIIRMEHRHGGYAICDWSDACTFDAGASVADAREDILGLGAIAFRALTGIRPDSVDGDVPAGSAPATGRAIAAPVSVVSVGTYCPSAPAELIALIDQMRAAPAKRPPASEVFARASWLCHTLEIAAPVEQPRWTPPRGFAAQGEAAGRVDEDHSGFAIRISRVRSR